MIVKHKSFVDKAVTVPAIKAGATHELTYTLHAKQGGIRDVHDIHEDKKISYMVGTTMVAESTYSLGMRWWTGRLCDVRPMQESGIKRFNVAVIGARFVPTCLTCSTAERSRASC